MEPDEIILVPHTHWDREWYLPFEAFLPRLVEMMDGLIELLDEEPRFAHFHLDGQATVIDDYLDVRPEREADVRRLAAAGRISVGPWYTQMDEFLVSGESLVRNLEWGLRRAAELGAEAPPAGYLPDQFGHVGQMPQILRNAGLERAVVWRGVPSAIDRTVFLWEAPDGSRVLTEYLAFGYGLGGWMVKSEDSEALAGHLRKAVELLAPLSPRDRLLVPVGGDHQVPSRKLAPLLAEAARQVGVRARIGSIADYVGLDEVPDPVAWRGELRSAARAHLLPGVYSTRAHQKRDRAQIEALIERYAEPLGALVPGYEWPEEELRDAWRLLLWNGAHDSVCGCSVDEVAREVDGRNGEAGAIANDIIETSLAGLAAGMGPAGTMYFNPSPFERFGVPGMGWKVGAEIPIHPEIPLRLVNGHMVTAEQGGVRLRVVDEGDSGDLYNFCPASGSPPVEPGELVERDGRFEARFDGVTVELRAEQGPEQRSLRLAVRIVNERPDHRLRLHVGVDGPVSGSVALAPFEVVERPRASEGGTETPSPTWPARGAVLAGGMVVFREGVFEYEVIPDPPELAVTLLRCVGTISRPEIATRSWAAGPDIATPEAQMIGEHRMWLGIRRGGRPSELPSEWERAMLPLLAVPAGGGGDLPQTGSLLEISGAELSSVRRVDGRVEVRMWNPSQDVRDAVVDGRPIRLGPGRIETVRPGGD